MSASHNPTQTTAESLVKALKTSSHGNGGVVKSPQEIKHRTKSDTVVLRVDGSYRQEKDLATVGWVIKNNRGDTLEKIWKKAPSANTSMETEAWAALTGILESQKYDPEFIILYSDCDPLIQKIERHRDTEEYETIEKGTIYEQIALALDTAEEVSINEISRDLNKEAHNLAQLGARKVRRKRIDS